MQPPVVGREPAWEWPYLVSKKWSVCIFLLFQGCVHQSRETIQVSITGSRAVTWLCVRNSPALGHRGTELHILLTNNPAAFYSPASGHQSLDILRAIAEREAQLRIAHCVKQALNLGKEANIPASQMRYIKKHSTKDWPWKVSAALGFPGLFPLGHRATCGSQIPIQNKSVLQQKYRQNSPSANPTERKEIQRIIKSFLLRNLSCFSIQVPRQKKLFSACLGGNACTCCSRNQTHFSLTHPPAPASATRHREISVLLQVKPPCAGCFEQQDHLLQLY